MDFYKWPQYKANISEELKRFCQGDDFNHWNLGDLYDSVPQKYAEKMHCKYGVFVNSGTAGLHASLIACGLKPGDEVIVPAMTFIRSVTPLAHLQLVPVLVDVDPTTGNICPDAVKKAITAKTKAVIAVHMWGIPADCFSLQSICNAAGIDLIEDCSHSHFSECLGQPVGSFGRVSFMSLQRKKTLSVGEGGLIATNDKQVFEKLREITSPGSFVPSGTPYSEVDFSGFGLNMRMSPFSAVVAKSLFAEIDDIIEARAKAAELFQNALENECAIAKPVTIPQYASRVSWYSYKPKLKKLKLEQVSANAGPLKWGAFGYPAISEHAFWKKSTNYFPFSSMPMFRKEGEFPGLREYTNNRVTLNLPNVSIDYWTPETIRFWTEKLILKANDQMVSA